ncbi:MAG: class I SAM-dependent methyltransferase [Saprospiraceae bacterium]
MFGKIRSLIEYYLKSDTIYRLHAPSFYNLAQTVFEKKDYYYDFDILHNIYYEVINNKDCIHPNPFADQRNQSHKSIGDFALRALHNPKELQKLYKLVRWFKPKSILELGGCMGVSSLCLRLASYNAEIISIEGNEQFVEVAKNNSQNQILKPIKFIHSLFEPALETLLDKKFDMVILDGDHSYDATITLINKLLPLLEENSMILMDDIHWSSGMYKAWKEIKRNKRFSSSLEALRWGLLFTNKSLTPIHYSLVPSSLKFWQKYF